MKNVLVILAGSLLATTAKAQMPSPVDSLKISKDVSLDEVVITATKVGKETPVAYSDISAGTTDKVSHSLSPNPRLLS